MTQPIPSANLDLENALRLHQDGKLQEAKRAYLRILDLAPQHAKTLSLLGKLCAQTGDWNAAKKHLTQALDLAPKHADTLESLAMVHEAQNEWVRSQALYQQAIALNPDNAHLHNNYGDLLRKMGILEESRIHFLKALSLQPRFAIAQNNLGVCLQALKRIDDAETAFRAAIAIEPKYNRAQRNLGALLLDSNRFREAAEQLEVALTLNPNDGETLGHYGLALLNLRRPEEAVQHLRKSITLAPKASVNWVNYGLTLQELGDSDAALEAFEQAKIADPNNLHALWHRTFAHFLRGEWQQAWEDYECRIKIGNLESQLLEVPLWQGESLTGKRILLIGEQGLGDEIMFASCVAEIAKQAKATTLSSDVRLIPLFARSFPHVTCVRTGALKKNTEPKRDQEFDYQILMGSVPRLLRQDAKNYHCKAYLVADPARVACWKERYATLGTKVKIGISWRGGNFYSGEKRSTELALWGNLLKETDAHFINVQYKSTAEEIAELEALGGKPIHHWSDSDPMQEQDDFAAQLSALDLVISVTNATVHLAGALGLPTWTLLSLIPSWRWTMKGETTLWYPNVRFIRQPTRGDWDSVFSQLQTKLHAFIASQR